MPRVVAGDAKRRSGSFARLNTSPRAGANLRSLQERPHEEAAPCPHCKDAGAAVGPYWIPLSARSRRATRGWQGYYALRSWWRGRRVTENRSSCHPATPPPSSQMSPRRIASATACARSTRSQFLEDDLQPLLDRDLGTARGQTDLPVGGAFARPTQDLQIIRGEIGRALGLLPRQTAELQQHAIQQLRAELTAAAGRGTDRRDQLLRRRCS